MFKKINYQPFNKNTNFFAIVKNGVVEKIENKKYRYNLQIKKGGYAPKTGIFVAESLPKYNFKNKIVLDIGTGDTGLLAIHAAARGAKLVIGLDVDKQTIKWAKVNANLNNLQDRVKFKQIDIKEYRPELLFDVIISNPPQMPTKKSESTHDDGGPDGKEYINFIIYFSSKYLKNNGSVFFTSFDFLGINKSYNNQASLEDSSKKMNFNLSIINKQQKEIKKGSYTDKNLSWIKKQYPKYQFLKNNRGFLSYYIYLVRGKKL